jgi:chemotaxis protein MotB
MSRRKEHHEEHADERWLVTYADMLTLMFVVFMVLFSISVVNTGKFELLKESLSQALSSGLMDGGSAVMEQGADTSSPPVVEETPGSINPQISGPLGMSLQTGSSADQALESAQMQAAKASVDEAAKKAGVSDQVTTTVSERGLTIRLQSDPFLFDSGSAALHTEALTLLRPVATTVAAMPNAVIVEGHTDSNSIGTAQFPSNWELGAGRSCAVLRALATDGVPTSRMACASYGALKPVADNGTALGRQQNRRVEIVVTRNYPGEDTSLADG